MPNPANTRRKKKETKRRKYLRKRAEIAFIGLLPDSGCQKMDEVLSIKGRQK